MIKVGVFDLDETLIRVNSFKMWVIYSAFFILFDFKNNVSLFKLYTLRLQGRSDRYSFKKDLLSLQTGSVFWCKLANFYVFLLTLCVNKRVLKQVNKFDINILATAAPSVYVIPFFTKYLNRHFQDFVCTSSSSSVYCELLGENKRDFVARLLSENLAVERDKFHVTLFSDSIEDLPLALFSDQFYLIYTNDYTKQFFYKHIPNLIVFD